MNRLIIDKASDITLQNGTIVIDNQTKVPLKALDALIVSYKCDIDLKTIAKISKADISILVVTTRPKEFIHIQKNYYKNGYLKEAQYHALHKKVDIAKAILKKKIDNCTSTLKALDIDFDSTVFTKELSDAQDISTLLGIEGNIAKHYFKHYFSIFPKLLCKGSRTKHPPKDPVNALLSYLYTIVYYDIATRLNYYGFEPTIGYLHKAFREHMALASDILEILRGDVELFTAQIIHQKTLLPHHFTNRSDAVYLTDKGKKELWKPLKNFLEQLEPKTKKEISWIRNIIEKSSTSPRTQK